MSGAWSSPRSSLPSAKRTSRSQRAERGARSVSVPASRSLEARDRTWESGAESVWRTITTWQQDRVRPLVLTTGTSTVVPPRGQVVCTPSCSARPARDALSFCQRHPCGILSSARHTHRLLVRPVVMRNARSRVARHRPVAQDQLSSNTCVCVPTTGSHVRMNVSISAIVLWNATASRSHTASCRPTCGARGHRRSSSTERSSQMTTNAS